MRDEGRASMMRQPDEKRNDARLVSERWEARGYEGKGEDEGGRRLFFFFFFETLVSSS